MILALIVWLVMTVFPLLSKLSVLLTIVGVACVVVSLILVTFPDEDVSNGSKKIMRSGWLKVTFLAAFLCALVPSKETSWYIVGAYATQTVVQSDTAKELAGDGVDVLKSLMKKAKTYIDEAEQPKKEVKQ